MAIRIYNSLSGQREEFIPQEPGEVKMYVCGVTVYDSCHIGHARSLFVFDGFRRYLRHRGLRVHFVRNITDIDDKIIAKAQETASSAPCVAERFIQEYYHDLQKLEIEPADAEPRATENIPEMIEFIQGLVNKKYAYVVDKEVYFSVRSLPGYGRLSKQSLDQMQAGARIEVDKKKKDPLDFALWKSSQDPEPGWSSPWGRGRPGWHIECSTMSMKYLETSTLDIHAGGRDLIFPHHENEIAQAEALTGKPFARYWMHHGLVSINSQKMSKSLGNFISIQDFLQRYDANTLKIFFLSSHYGSNLDFTWEKIEEWEKARGRVEILLERLKDVNLLSLTQEAGSIQEGPLLKARLENIVSDTQSAVTSGGGGSGNQDILCGLPFRFEEALDDDFNTASALGHLFELVGYANRLLERVDKGALELSLAKWHILQESKVLGLNWKGAVFSPRDLAFIQSKIAKRNLYRRQKQYAQADQIRVELAGMGVILEDQKDGTTTFRQGRPQKQD